MVIRKLIITLIFACFTHVVSGQSVDADNQQLFEAARQAMANQEYATADKHFRAMLNSGQALPAEMCYYFAVTLFELEQYGNSKAFNEKYQKLTKKQGSLQQKSETLHVALLSKLEPAKACLHCDEAGYRLSACAVCEGQGTIAKACNACLGAKSLVCSVCKGEGVAISTDKLGAKVYATCATCGGNGQADCRTCAGEGYLPANCGVCAGTGQAASDKLCTHEKQLN